jgi:hypothetical protein
MAFRRAWRTAAVESTQEFAVTVRQARDVQLLCGAAAVSVTCVRPAERVGAVTSEQPAVGCVSCSWLERGVLQQVGARAEGAAACADDSGGYANSEDCARERETMAAGFHSGDGPFGLGFWA